MILRATEDLKNSILEGIFWRYGIIYQMVPGLSAQADRIGKSEFESQLEIDRKKNQLTKDKHKQKLSLVQKLKREILRLVYQLRLRFCKIGFY